MTKILNISLLILGLFFTSILGANGYDENVGHILITREAIERLKLEDQCIDESRLDKLYIGARQEDTTPPYIFGTESMRIFGHFDPMLPTLFSCTPNTWGIDGSCSINGTPNTHTWDDAISSLNFDDDKSLEHLGYVLHLLQDMSSPAHVRRDAHLGIDFDGDSFGDPFEAVGISQNPGAPPSSIPSFGTPKEYFDWLSTITRSLYFSTDSCFDPDQIGPNSLHDDNDYFYEGTDNSSRKLAHKGIRYRGVYGSEFQRQLEFGLSVSDADRFARDNSKRKAHIDYMIASEQFFDRSGYAIVASKELIKLYLKTIETRSYFKVDGSSDNPTGFNVTDNPYSTTDSIKLKSTATINSIIPVGVPLTANCTNIIMGNTNIAEIPGTGFVNRQINGINNGYTTLSIKSGDSDYLAINSRNIDIKVGIDHIKIKPSTKTVTPNGTVQFSVTAYADSAEQIPVNVPDIEYEWSASSGNIDASGLFSAGTASGQVTVTVIHVPTYTRATAIVNVIGSRFQNCGDGTIADTSTGLLWPKCGQLNMIGKWADAISYSNMLSSSTGFCHGLSDGSKAGDWRLPTIDELKSLICGPGSPAWISNGCVDNAWNPSGNSPSVWLMSQGQEFTYIGGGMGGGGYYWSSSTSTDYPNYAWVVNMDYGNVEIMDKIHSLNYWILPVRSGQCK